MAFFYLLVDMAILGTAEQARWITSKGYLYLELLVSLKKRICQVDILRESY